jgi:AraC family transcriptional regulator
VTGARPQLHPSAGRRFFGELRQRLELAEASLSETCYPDGFSAPSHVHDRAFLCLVLRGRYTESSGSSRRHCEPFTAIYHAAGETHSDRFHSEGACFNIELTSHERCEQLPTAALAPGSPIPFLAARLYVAFRCRDEAATGLTEELLLELTAPSRRRSSISRHPPSWLGHAIDWLEAPHGPTGIRPLAAALGLHPVYLARAFRRHLGCSPGEYQRRARLARAAVRLTSDALTSRVAAEAGFADQSHFHRCFGRAVGLAPGRWRALINLDGRQVAPVQAGTRPNR